jgi:Asp-tRNA(Asn)/Glu-tRNA(Gln) amidotransferase A subunit family amidase
MNASLWTRREFLKAGGAFAATLAAGGPAALARASSGLAFDEYVRMDAIALADLVAKGEISPDELLEAAIARCEQVNPRINAVVIEHFDLARKAARDGLPNGPLRGVPFLLKDLYMSLRGTVTSEGSIAFRDRVAAYDSTLVERYRAAGLNIFGKTASPEFGATATTESKLWGETRNPWNLAYSAGGSSGGSAAAIAAGILPAANASDGGGSIRIPAATCGLFGLKPTRARTPLGPNRWEGSNGLSSVHAITRSVRDSALLLDVTHGAAPYDPYAAPPVERPYMQELQRAPGKLRIGWLEQTITHTPVHPECERAAADAAKLCESLGHHVERTMLPIDPRSYYEAIGINSSVGFALAIRAREAELGRPILEDEVEPLNWVKLARADKLGALDLARARNTFHQVGQTVSEVMQRFDLLLSPTEAAPPPKLGVMSLSNPNEEAFTKAALDASIFTQVYNVSGQPAMSLPLHWTADGLPVGVMFAAAFGREDVLFRVAAQIEKAAPWFDKRPTL